MMNKIVSTVCFHDYILIFCDNGDIYRMIVEDITLWKCTFQRISKFRPLS